ncbi:hypothetical protein SAMN05421837_103483 [Amycolatopsis pretoriensis]|uniref:Lectin-like protein BA14k n=1 Tax=Amycolatopsis pretoriensis TaxID=218821 RepID=A0A1H5QKZ4_9PSEU|nr:hypothetical protein [Amycolatopsis pretoriensis]SEF26770.1 hypothetical protein SAMN05421837_103483 [Amycolatopsis pretoriensis]
MKRFAAIAVGLCLTAGCSPAAPVDDGSEFDEPSSPASTVTLPAPSPVPTSFPAGFPKVVSVASLPARLRDEYRAGGAAEAVEVAPGVWTPVQAAEAIVEPRVLDGYCASVKAFEEQYRAGREYPGTCW